MKKNISLFIISTVLFYFILELFFPFFIRYLPLRLQQYLPQEIRPLAASSKNGLIPQDYILIVGDSYAAGFGDWYLDQNKWENPKYSSAHCINTITDIDVLAIAQNGASSIGGMVVTPLITMSKIKNRFSINDPTNILIYFYEGNDLSDNISDLKNRPSSHINYINEDRIKKEEFFLHLDYISSLNDFSWIKSRLLFSRFFKRLLISVLKPKNVYNYSNNNQFATQIDSNVNLDHKNIVSINGLYYKLIDKLQSPALSLEKKEVDDGITIFEYCIEYFIKQFPNSKISIVYIPSPLSCYNLLSDVSIQIQSEKNKKIFYSKEFCLERSDFISNRVDNIAKKYNLNFINPLEYMKSFGSILHGPKDKKHFNKKGYELLSEFIVTKLFNN